MVRIEDVTYDDDGEESGGVELRRRNQAAAAARENNQVEASQNGEDEDANPETELTFDEQVDRAREQYQPTPLEKFLAIAKSLIMRALVVYFIMYFIRSNAGKPSTTTSDASGKVQAPASLASSNVFPNGTEFDMKD